MLERSGCADSYRKSATCQAKDNYQTYEKDIGQYRGRRLSRA